MTQREYARNNGGPLADRHCPCAQWLSKMTAFGVSRTVLAGESVARGPDDQSAVIPPSLLPSIIVRIDRAEESQIVVVVVLVVSLVPRSLLAPNRRRFPIFSALVTEG